ncbi:MAG: hypothetical protein NW237_02860 [Cyanobacteriota bacterium]|nr:hypothetical protein [Cyanobacteriota bacterium]
MNLEHDALDLSTLPEMVSSDASDLDFSQASTVDGIEPEDADLKAGGWLWYNNLAVNNEVGNLLLKDGDPLKAGRIRFFISDIHWRYGFSFSTAIRSPLGKMIPTPDGWRFSGLLRYAIVLFQPISDKEVKAWRINESSRETPQEVILDFQQPIYFNINDSRGSYGDNSGSFDVYVQVVG